MDKICTISTLLGIILAIACAFVAVPDSAAILLILGGVGALNTSSKPDLRLRIYAAAIVLILGAKTLVEIPVAGAPLAAIFSGVGIVFIGASVVGITLALIYTAKSNLLK